MSRFGTLTRVIPLFEFPICVLEVVLVMTNLVRDPVIIADLNHMQVCRLVTRGVRPPQQTQRKTFAAHGQWTALERVEVLEYPFGSGPQRLVTAELVATELAPIVEEVVL